MCSEGASVHFRQSDARKGHNCGPWPDRASAAGVRVDQQRPGSHGSGGGSACAHLFRNGNAKDTAAR